jgi:hypothetical protein
MVGMDVHDTSHNPLLSTLAALTDPTYWVCSAASALQKGRTNAVHTCHGMACHNARPAHDIQRWYGSSSYGKTPHTVLLTLVVVASCNDCSDAQVDDGSDSVIQSLVGTV